MAKRQATVVATGPGSTIELGGEELRLVRPKGRAGRRFIVRIQSTFDVLRPLMEQGDVLAKAKLTEEEQTDFAVLLFEIAKRLFLDEDLHFEDEILPGLYVYSHLGLTVEQAKKKLDGLDETPSEIVSQYMVAFQYFLSVDREDREAVDEALKKSEAGAETET
jgi:hypothetical protein